MDQLFNAVHVKDGILALLVIYLLVTDRMDRKADREFWKNFYQDHKKEK